MTDENIHLQIVLGVDILVFSFLKLQVVFFLQHLCQPTVYLSQGGPEMIA